MWHCIAHLSLIAGLCPKTRSVSRNNDCVSQMISRGGGWKTRNTDTKVHYHCGWLVIFHLGWRPHFKNKSMSRVLMWDAEGKRLLQAVEAREKAILLTKIFKSFPKTGWVNKADLCSVVELLKNLPVCS